LTDEVAAQKLLGIASDDDEESSLAVVEDQPGFGPRLPRLQ
jgi:hypothetical protein